MLVKEKWPIVVDSPASVCYRFELEMVGQVPALPSFRHLNQVASWWYWYTIEEANALA